MDAKEMKIIWKAINWSKFKPQLEIDMIISSIKLAKRRNKKNKNMIE